MKITRSSKGYFNKWLTHKKQQELKELLVGHARICNYFVEKYENEIPQKKKFDLSVHDSHVISACSVT